jgi:hypothetical protein
MGDRGRICQWLGRTCEHPETFLRLPQAVRWRIYAYAGLILNHTIFLQPGCANVNISAAEYNTTAALLRLCSRIRGEVSVIIFGCNDIVLTQDNLEYGLPLLASLPPDTCRSLRSLSVELSLDTIVAWQAAIGHILSHVAPGKLKLNLTCDTERRSLASKAVEPFKRWPGLLGDLQIRFNESFTHRQLVCIAEDARRRAVVDAPEVQRQAQEPFPFFELPLEVRRSILEYTNLVTPLREVQWQPGSGFSIQTVFCECQDANVCGEPDIHFAQSFIRCEAGAFCARQHSASSSRCIHELSPLSLFLVSRAMFEEAMAVFYSLNKITIVPLLGPSILYYLHLDHVEEDNATQLFVERHARPELLRYLRHVEVVFPGIDPNAAQPSWRLAMERLARYADIPSLTLSLVLRGQQPHPQPEFYSISAFHSHWNEGSVRFEQLKPLLRMDSPVLSPLRGMSCLRRLFVHLQWPGHWSPPRLRDFVNGQPQEPSPGCGIGLHSLVYEEMPLTKLETQMERMIMGDGYDSWTLGKADMLPCPYIRNCWDRYNI